MSHGNRQGDSMVFQAAEKPACVQNCPIEKETRIVFKPELWYGLMQAAKDIKTEWLVFLTGDRDVEGSRVVIDGHYFPKQYATGTSCEALPGEMRPRTVGSLHSHVMMGAFFSSTDMEHMNTPVEIVINGKGEYVSLVEVTLGCGRQGYTKGVVCLDIPTFKQPIEDNIQSRVQTVHTGGVSYTVGGRTLDQHRTSYAPNWDDADVPGWEWDASQQRYIPLPEDKDAAAAARSQGGQLLLTDGSSGSMRLCLKCKSTATQADNQLCGACQSEAQAAMNGQLAQSFRGKLSRRARRQARLKDRIEGQEFPTM